MWNNGSLLPLPGRFVDDSVCPVVPRGSTWARNPVPRIHDDNLGMAWIGGCWGQRGPPGQVSQTRGDPVVGSGEGEVVQVCRQEGAPVFRCPDKEDCSNFPTPCPGLDQGWYGGNATHMPTEFHPPDDNCTRAGAGTGHSA